MKLLRVTATTVCMLASAACVQDSAPERVADTVCRSRLALHADTCVEKAVASLKRIVQAREKRFYRRDDCSFKATRSSEPSISFFSVFLNPLEYPPDRLSGGAAVVRMQVDAAGTLRSVQVVQSSGDPAQDAAAAETVWNWCYVPAQRDGRDEGGFVEHRFDFDPPAEN
ncbi:energy transducer TonB [Stenotrophomonas sp. B1-1]|uniref:energy transducer TonB family protein n=1 Tax=Stenotrophomonas sp. B1-1 TaxID=2710648 RepID=UPI0013DBEE30|nr:energy transducer TonB [Stenotrophomonas sp. B1-1]